MQGDGFFQKGLSTDAHRIDSSVDGGMTAHHDDGHGQQTGRGPLFEQGDAIGVRHPDVEQNQIRAKAGTDLSRLRSVLRKFNGMPFIVENFREQVPDTQLVIDHQNVCHVACTALEK